MEKASGLLLKRLQEQLQYNVPELDNFMNFQKETQENFKNCFDQIKFIGKKFDRFHDNQQEFNKFAKSKLEKHETELENHDDRIKRCLGLLYEKDQ